MINSTDPLCRLSLLVSHNNRRASTNDLRLDLIIGYSFAKDRRRPSQQQYIPVERVCNQERKGGCFALEVKQRQVRSARGFYVERSLYTHTKQKAYAIRLSGSGTVARPTIIHSSYCLTTCYVFHTLKKVLKGRAGISVGIETTFFNKSRNA
jgi:hypothetical protein